MRTLIALVTLAVASAHKCVHDHVVAHTHRDWHRAFQHRRPAPLPMETASTPPLQRRLRRATMKLASGALPQPPPQQKQQRRARELADGDDDDLQPLRIGWVAHDVSALDAAQLALVRDELMPATVAYWSRALRVRRSTAPLRMLPRCADGIYWAIDGVDPPLCDDGVEAPACGGEVPAVPAQYLASRRWCDGGASNAECYGEHDCGSCGNSAQGAGADGVDFFVFVTAVETAACGGGTTAYAAFCATAEEDDGRPLFASINFCPGDLTQGDAGAVHALKATALHEMAHALGFSAKALPTWRDASAGGAPRTPSPPEVSYACDGDVWTAQIPGDTTLASFEERGLGGAQCGYPNGGRGGTYGQCVLRVVTPAVKREARAYFGCDDLAGMELENHMTTPCALFGSHWEQRVMAHELMASTSVSPAALVSRVTLALFEDSGWYAPDYAAAGHEETGGAAAGVGAPFSLGDELSKGLDWGFQQGCGFARDDACVDPATGSANETEHGGHYCDAGDADTGCTLDRLSWGSCNLENLTSAIPQAPFRYFPDESARGGDIPEADYCPFRVKVTGKTCIHAEHAPDDDAVGGNSAGEVYGATSRCFASDLHRWVGGYIIPHEVGCYAVSCAADRASYVITIAGAGGTETTVACTTADTDVAKTVDGFSGHLGGGTITCVDPGVLCRAHKPTHAPTSVPTQSPTSPTAAPTAGPSASPSPAPTASPSPLACANGVRDGDESDVDCGGIASGSKCPPCSAGLACTVGTDCAGGVCQPDVHTCDVPTAAPSRAPSGSPSASPTPAPSGSPSASPTPAPTPAPTVDPEERQRQLMYIGAGALGGLVLLWLLKDACCGRDKKRRARAAAAHRVHIGPGDGDGAPPPEFGAWRKSNRPKEPAGKGTHYLPNSADNVLLPWQCRFCSFLNENVEAPVCEMCGKGR